MVLDSMPDSDISADQISINLSDGPESHRNSDAGRGPETIGANEENKQLEKKETPSSDNKACERVNT